MEHFVFIIFIIATSTQLFIFLFVFFPIALFKKNNNLNENLSVSVIISARNEEKNLKNNLESVLTQNYENFEVIVINDDSNDGTEQILANFQKKYKNLKILTIKNKKEKGKKQAITKAMENSENEIILLTDADCKPLTNNWIKTLINNYNPQTDIVLGYSPYQRKKGLINKFIQFDTLYTAMEYFAFAILKKPYMGVGRNLSYRKKLFDKNKGFEKHKHIIAGDDDLFVNQNATKINTTIDLSGQSFVISIPQTRFKKLLKQKLRHIGVGKEYKTKNILELSGIWMSHFSFYLLFFYLLIIDYKIIIVISLFLFKQLFTFFTYYKILKQFQQIYILPYVLLADFFYHVLYHPTIVLLSMLKTDKKW